MENAQEWDWTNIVVDHPREFAYVFAPYLDSREDIEAAYQQERRHMLACPQQEARLRGLKHLDEAYRDAIAYFTSRLYSRPYGPDVPVPSGEVTMPRRNAKPPQAKWEALLANEPKAALAAARKLDLPSDSEHDMVLANVCAEAEWSGQEIADVLAWNRRRRREDVKREGYYKITVRKALQWGEKSR